MRLSQFDHESAGPSNRKGARSAALRPAARYRGITQGCDWYDVPVTASEQRVCSGSVAEPTTCNEPDLAALVDNDHACGPVAGGWVSCALIALPPRDEGSSKGSGFESVPLNSRLPAFGASPVKWTDGFGGNRRPAWLRDAGIVVSVEAFLLSALFASWKLRKIRAGLGSIIAGFAGLPVLGAAVWAVVAARHSLWILAADAWLMPRDEIVKATLQGTAAVFWAGWVGSDWRQCWRAF